LENCGQVQSFRSLQDLGGQAVGEVDEVVDLQIAGHELDVARTD